MAYIDVPLFEYRIENIGHSPASVIAPDTRAQAHDKMKPTVKSLRVRLVKDFFERSFTADEWATEKGLSILNVRPRVSELNKKSMLHRVGFGLTQEGNKQEKFTLYPYLCDRLERLAGEFGLDEAAEELLAQFGL